MNLEGVVSKNNKSHYLISSEKGDFIALKDELEITLVIGDKVSFQGEIIKKGNIKMAKAFFVKKIEK